MNKQKEFIEYNIKELEANNEQLNKLMNRNNAFTSYRGWEHVTVEEHATGYYYKFKATRSKCNIFINRLGETVRKPNNSIGKEIYYDNN